MLYKKKIKITVYNLITVNCLVCDVSYRALPIHMCTYYDQQSIPNNSCSIMQCHDIAFAVKSIKFSIYVVHANMQVWFVYNKQYYL